MIEFGTKRSGNGKKSRIHRKFPRKRVAKVGERVARWFRSNWDDDWFYDQKINKLTWNYERVYLWGIGAGINRYTWASQSRLCPRVTYEVSDGWDVKSDRSDLIFITKIIR